MTRCLWITRQEPRAANAGDIIYSLGLLRALAATGRVELTVLTHRDRVEVSEIEYIDFELPCFMPPKSASCMISPLPADAHRMGNPEMRRRLRELIAAKNFQRVVIDQAACSWALDLIPGEIPVLYIAHNHETALRAEIAAGGRGPTAPLYRYDAWKYGRMETKLCRRAKWISAITPRDEAAFRQKFPGKDYLQLTPGFEGPVPEGDAAEITAETPRKVVLGGTFEWLAKRRNLEAFLGDAARHFPAAGIDFQIVGKADPDHFAELAKRYPWAKFDANVPSMDPYLRGARIGLIPEALGGGFKLKALDYIFRGLPLASIESALSGLPVSAGDGAIAAHTTAGLAEKVAAVIDDLDQLNRHARVALDRCRGAFHWSDRGDALADCLCPA
ncbi:hypothetical protein [Haloferula sargassicola]|uniref:Glycosyltransferase subfamily 4-like N-terminal domain-containing protein n=1 Tax=Haloferula sargassicola TaxID=490096 RepID=A0ABP9URN1_9BACT